MKTQTLDELMGKITPLPWNLTLWDDSGLVAPSIDQDCQPGEKYKSDTLKICYFPPNIKINKPNALYLNHAANNFPKLVEALKYIYECGSIRHCEIIAKAALAVANEIKE